MDKKSSPKNIFQQLIRFGFVGGSATILDYAIMIFLTEVFNINYLLSSSISFSISVIYNYFLSVKWVFNVSENRNKTFDFTVFIILSIIGLGINQLIMWLSVSHFNIHYIISKVIATIIVMIFNFITRKIFLEK